MIVTNNIFCSYEIYKINNYVFINDAILKKKINSKIYS